MTYPYQQSRQESWGASFLNELTGEYVSSAHDRLFHHHHAFGPAEVGTEGGMAWGSHTGSYGNAGISLFPVNDMGLQNGRKGQRAHLL